MKTGAHARSLLSLAMLLLLAGAAWAEVCPFNEVPKATLAQYDQQVVLTEAEKQQARTEHAPWGAARLCNRLLEHREYLVCYDPQTRVALWVAYRLRAADVTDLPRKNAFRTDPRLTADETAVCDDYRGSGYDRGHAVPRSDMNRSPVVQANTFLLSNMAPQTPILNRGMWAYLEDSVRQWAVKFNEVYVMSGSVFMGSPHTLPSGRVGIPRQFYKIIVRVDPTGQLQSQAFLLTNGKSLPIPPTQHPVGVPGQHISAANADSYLATRLKPIIVIRLLAHTDFFPDLPPAQKQALVHADPSDLWPK